MGISTEKTGCFLPNFTGNKDVAGKCFKRNKSRLRMQAETKPQGQVDAVHFFAGDDASATDEARFFDGHYLLTFYVGVVGQTIFE